MTPRTFLLLAAASLCAAASLAGQQVELSAGTRAGLDTNPLGTGGTSATVIGDKDTLTYALSAGVGVTFSATSPAQPSLKLNYAGEAVRFDRWSDENYSTHRLGLNGKLTAGPWKLTADGSVLFVAGSDETLPTLSSVNANAVSLWRERRRQWQDRLKLQGQAEFGACLVRVTGTLLAYDYDTRVQAGRVAFADRSDAQLGLDVGWIQSPASLWFVGVRAGHQDQATIPLPGAHFDYSNDYSRLAAGWEGKPFANTTVTFAAGPDFRRYSGTVDPAVFHDRDRTSLWFEGGFSSKLTQALTLTGKAVRTDWLSSTGKSAYNDTCVETALSWTLTPAWTVRLTGKIHRCDYFPTVRDDWETLIGAGATLKMSPNTLLNVDVLGHRAWNNMSGIPQRDFERFVFNVGVTVKL